MIEKITIRQRGSVSKRVFNNANKAAYLDDAQFFHDHLRDRRFTESHGQAAGYRRRSPEYLKRKQRQFGHQRPLEFEGQVRDLVGIQYRVTSTSKMGKVVYAGARGFNRRPAGTNLDMAAEFRTILPEENEQFAIIHDRRLDIELNRVDEESTTVIT